ncbi:MAG: restriction endonuclease subunit S [Candidatus Omnitrophota bacterium]
MQQCGQANFNGTKLKNTLVPLPSSGEQERIVKRIVKLMQYCDELEAKINQSKSDSEKLMQAVLQEAFS